MSIDTSKRRWELSEEAQYAVQWFEENGFTGHLEKQYLSKTVFLVHRDGITEIFELPSACRGPDIKDYMEQFANSFDLHCKLEALR